MGIGVHGLADTFAILGYAFDSSEARELDVKFFENMYYAAVETSCELAKERGVYPTYEGSPANRGELQFDMWREEGGRRVETTLDWGKLKREKLSEYGLRNSYLLAPMPTASTARILGNSEPIEQFTSNTYARKVTNGFFNVVNKQVYKRLMKQGIWSSGLGNLLATTRGSMQDIEGIDADTKLMFRTVWEIPKSRWWRWRPRSVSVSQHSYQLLDLPQGVRQGKCSSLHNLEKGSQDWINLPEDTPGVQPCTIHCQ